MPTLSVVVPIYNVEEYLERCLDTIAAQTWTDLEVILVDDGATDSSPQIAEAYTRRDERFKLVHRPNGGLSAARNTGIEHATGDYLAFVDSDDELPEHAYELLAGSLERSGSDFATGKVLRLTTGGTRPTRFLRKTFWETKVGTHITEFRALLADRIAWNKVFRRSFWDAHGLRFPEGRINEDIPVILPLHFAAKAVDVISEPVYLWRFRDTGELSITEKRAEPYALNNRLMAVTDVHDYLAAHAPPEAKHWYDESLVADDLKYYLNVLDRATDEYRELFFDKVNALLDGADDDIYAPLPAIERLKWHLVRRRLMPELLEVLRFWREELDSTPPVQVGDDWYGDYPFRTDERLAIPADVYRLGSNELTPEVVIEDFRLEGGRLRIDGRAHIAGIGAAEPGAQKVMVGFVEPAGRFDRLRHRLATARFKVTPKQRPDANVRTPETTADLMWTGFSAVTGARRLARKDAWQLWVTIAAGGVRRRSRVMTFEPLRRPQALELPAPDGRLARVATGNREITVTRTADFAVLGSYEVSDGELVLAGEIHGGDGEGRKLELREVKGARKRRYTISDGTAFSVRIPLDDVAARMGDVVEDDEDDEDEDDDEQATVLRPSSTRDPAWELWIAGGGHRTRVALPRDAPRVAWPAGDREVALTRARSGDAELTVRARRAWVTAAALDADGVLTLTGTGGLGADDTLILYSPDRAAQHPFAQQREGDRWTAVATPAAVESLAGALPLAEGWWRLRVGPPDAGEPEELMALSPSPELVAQLPLDVEIDHKSFVVSANAEGELVLVVGRDIADTERGPLQQRVLRHTAYTARRSEPLTDTVVYTSFRGRQYSDSPRALHEELVRRGTPLEHLWVVRDAACRVPDTARVLRAGTREHYEALARTRYYISNDHFASWFERRDDQVCVQTWHGTPLKRLGFDVSSLRGSTRQFERNWDMQLRNWQYVVSPNRFATPILQRAYRLDQSEMLETGYPRTDVLAGAGREERTRALRERLGIPAGVRVVLYAPTFRDQVRDARGRYRLDLRLDLDRLREAAGGGRDEILLLIRKHHYIVDAIPSKPWVRDVSAYPDGTELLLAADVLITDYSSMTVDFANTGRPILFFTYDLDAYADEIRGFYVDFEATVPGPLLATSDAVGEALRDLDAVRAQYADRYAAFTERFCALDDGGAAARVVDRVFG
ncbi:MAG: CDP-glycerol glycerophosphotransferase [Solirubrobacteraceae bacterium]|nr:CDP-glycerol glycerophosphotransferase [Solirubrobacteraceae bacterium]